MIDGKSRGIPAGGEDQTAQKPNWVKPLVLVFLIGGMISLGWIMDLGSWLDPKRIADFLEGFGVAAPIVYMLIMTGAVVISPIPSLPLDVAAGVLFGPFLGTVYSVLGASAGALISFFIARVLGREAITHLLRSDIGFCDHCTERRLFIAILIARLLPIFSFDLISYGAGITRISIRGFVVATFIGMIPPTFAFNYWGSSIFYGSGYTILLGVLLILFFLLVPKWTKQYNPWGLYDRLEPHRDNRNLPR